MGRARLIARAAAVAILFVAAFEIFGCALCSGDTCTLQGTLSHQSHQPTSSGDQCLCCCTHILVVSTAHVDPINPVEPVPGAELRQATIERQSSVYHPPRVVVL